MSFREKFLQQAGKYKKTTVVIPNIGKVEVKEPSAKQRSMIYQASQVIKQIKGETHIETDPSKLNAWSVITCCYDPETGKHVFAEGDLGTLLEMPVSVLDKLAKPVLEFVGEDDEEELEKK